MSAGDPVNLIEGQIPTDYHCSCDYCRRAIGELRPPGGGYYSRLERREYYDSVESGSSPDAHVAKTPLHVARWLVQAYTDPGDWVLDPTIGAGTTAVEAITQNRNVAGMELQFSEALRSNLAAARNALLAPGDRVARPSTTETVKVKNVDKRGKLVPGELELEFKDKVVRRYGSIESHSAAVTARLREKGVPAPEAKIRIGDARRVGAFLGELGIKFSLVINNPPYSGDESDGGMGANHPLKDKFKYKEGLPNLAFLDEGPAYWNAMREIYAACIEHLAPGGHFAYGIKDMMRRQKPFMLHQQFDELLEKIGLEHVGTAFLKHNPTTLFLNTYFKRYGVHPPYYQTIGVFRKPGGPA